MCRTTANEFLQIRCFPNNPSPASRELPLHKGAMGRCIFSFVPQKKQTQNLSFQTRKRQENKSCAFSFSRLRRQLPLGGSLCLCVFSLCATEKTKEIFRTSKPKIRTFFFCGSTVGHYEPSSGRKVSRVSVTEGGRGGKRRRKTERRALSVSRLRRQLPLGGSL